MLTKYIHECCVHIHEYASEHVHKCVHPYIRVCPYTWVCVCSLDCGLLTRSHIFFVFWDRVCVALAVLWLALYRPDGLCLKEWSILTGRSHTRKNWLSFSQKPSAVNSSSARDGASWVPSHSMLECWLVCRQPQCRKLVSVVLLSHPEESSRPLALTVFLNGPWADKE